MTDPHDVTAALERASDAFDHGLGDPVFEPGIDSSGDAEEGAVSLQKGCRLIQSAEFTLANTDFFTSVVEHAFAAVERTFEGYLVLVAGDRPDEFRNHTRAYQRARDHVPLDEPTVEGIEYLYGQHRTSTYYGTSVATADQARALLDLAETVHRHLVEFDPEIEQYCICEC